MNMISAAIVTLNEDTKLEKCLASIEGFADEIIVVDLGSSDKTKEVCKRAGAKLLKHEFRPYVELLRNFAISQTKGDWILILDPDETVSDNLKNKLKQIVSEEKYVAVNIPRKNLFFGKWISHSNWWPDRHIRFFKKGHVVWSDRIHSYPKVDGQMLSLSADEDLAISHFGYDNLSQFLDRQNRYSDIEAKQKYQSGERFSWKGFLWLPLREFLVRFIKHQGFLDGGLGFSLTAMMMIYQLAVVIKLWELEQRK